MYRRNLFFSLSMCLSIYVSLYIYYIYISMYLFIYVYIYLSISLSMYLFINVSFYLRIYFSIYLSTDLSIYLCCCRVRLRMRTWFPFPSWWHHVVPLPLSSNFVVLTPPPRHSLFWNIWKNFMMNNYIKFFNIIRIGSILI